MHVTTLQILALPAWGRQDLGRCRAWDLSRIPHHTPTTPAINLPVDPPKSLLSKAMRPWNLHDGGEPPPPIVDLPGGRFTVSALVDSGCQVYNNGIKWIVQSGVIDCVNLYYIHNKSV